MPWESLLALRRLAHLQTRVSLQMDALHAENNRLQQALMTARGREIVAVSRLALAIAPQPPAAQDDSPNHPPPPRGLVMLSSGATCDAKNPPVQPHWSLLAAEVVICQSGCLSHDAYWRVQEYCRRHGKRCVLLDENDVDSILVKPES